MSGPVLVVDDEPDIRMLARVNLELAGFSVLEAGDGDEALRLAALHSPSIVFLDLMLPGLDGWDVLAGLSANPATAATPVVMLTARSAEADQVRAWGAGVIDFLSKPFDPSTLVDWATEAELPRDHELEGARRHRIIEQLSLLRSLREPDEAADGTGGA